jgi:hypothetical protein
LPVLRDGMQISLPVALLVWALLGSAMFNLCQAEVKVYADEEFKVCLLDYLETGRMFPFPANDFQIQQANFVLSAKLTISQTTLAKLSSTLAKQTHTWKHTYLMVYCLIIFGGLAAIGVLLGQFGQPADQKRIEKMVDIVGQARNMVAASSATVSVVTAVLGRTILMFFK